MCVSMSTHAVCGQTPSGWQPCINTDTQMHVYCRPRFMHTNMDCPPHPPPSYVTSCQKHGLLNAVRLMFCYETSIHTVIYPFIVVGLRAYSAGMNTFMFFKVMFALLCPLQSVTCPIDGKGDFYDLIYHKCY